MIDIELSFARGGPAFPFSTVAPPSFFPKIAIAPSPVHRSTPDPGALSGSLRLATSPVPGEVEFPAVCGDPNRQHST